MNTQDQKPGERLYMKHYSGRKPKNTNEIKINVQDTFSAMNMSDNAFFWDSELQYYFCWWQVIHYKTISILN